MGTSAGPSELAIGPMQGIVHGGPNPIIGATVTLYETQTSASTCTTGCSTYGSAGKSLATATTGSYGQFTFGSLTSTCTSTEYAYVAVTGGNTGANTTNNNVVLMAALGSCSNVNSNTQIYVSELSTVAAAYALGNFMTVSGAAGAQVVKVGAPYTNNGVPSCTVNTSLVTTACVAGGLGHAFQNAMNLVSAVSFNGATLTPGANTAMPGNTTSVIPASLINTLGSLLQTCVNSSGGTGSTTSCGKLFTDATPPGGTAPSDTLTAMIDIAKNPTNNVSTLYGLVTAVGAFYNPVIATPGPTDFSLAVFYSGVPNSTACPNSFSGNLATGTPTSYSYSNADTFFQVPLLALDISDNVYAVTNQQTATIPNVILQGMTYSGACIFTNIGDIQTNSGTNYGIASPSSLATDTLGQLWLSNSTSVGAIKQPRRHSVTTGALITPTISAGTVPFFFASAIDRSNNFWYGVAVNNGNGAFTSGAQCLGAVLISGTTAPYTYTRSTTIVPTCGLSTATEGAYEIAVDSNQNIWASNPGPYPGGGTSVSPSAVFVLPNQTPTGTASYGTTPTTNYVALANNGYKTGKANSLSGLALDSSGNVWLDTVSSLTEAAPTSTSGVVTGVGTPTVTTDSQAAPGLPNFDGNNVLWFPNYDTSSTVSYGTASGVTSLTPCYVASGGTACDYTHAEFGTRAQVDSTGSVWVSIYGNGALTAPAGQSGLLEIIGTAAPAWPQLSWGYPGVKP